MRGSRVPDVRHHSPRSVLLVPDSPVELDLKNVILGSPPDGVADVNARGKSHRLGRHQQHRPRLEQPRWNNHVPKQKSCPRQTLRNLDAATSVANTSPMPLARPTSVLPPPRPRWVRAPTSPQPKATAGSGWTTPPMRRHESWSGADLQMRPQMRFPLRKEAASFHRTPPPAARARHGDGSRYERTATNGPPVDATGPHLTPERPRLRKPDHWQWTLTGLVTGVNCP